MSAAPQFAAFSRWYHMLRLRFVLCLRPPTPEELAVIFGTAGLVIAWFEVFWRHYL
jgi:hypothetical protein